MAIIKIAQKPYNVKRRKLRRKLPLDASTPKSLSITLSEVEGLTSV